LEFDENSKIFKEHKLTTAEILALVSDLKIIGKYDFKKNF